MNKLYFGDNLEILRDKIDSESVDLIYLDPPFQSGKDYNIIFKPSKFVAETATAQVRTFEDTWAWGLEPEREYNGLITGAINKEKPNQKLLELMKSMRSYLGECSMLAYLCMMAPRLLEMRRVLKRTGSIYLHCDPTASHYLKLLMDAIFGMANFRNEIVWKRFNFHADAKRFGRLTDRLLFYTKTDKFTWSRLARQYSESYIESHFKLDKKGRYFRLDNLNPPGGRGPIYEFCGVKRAWRFTKEKMEKLKAQGHIYTGSTIPQLIRYLDEMPGQAISELWVDVFPVNPMSKERQGYPTQKPEALIERIIRASSNERDLILDPFCGCGTTVAVAQALHRKWIGIDITYLAIDVIKKRLEKNGIKEGKKFVIEGEPTDPYSAAKLAAQDPFQFQLWCISKIDATPSQTKSGDQGIDGFINFLGFDRKGTAGKGIVQVKGTQVVNPSMVRDLKGTMKSQNSEFGILITLKKPTQGMINEATKEGFYEYGRKQIPRIQLITVEDLFKNPLPLILPATPYIIGHYKNSPIKGRSQQEMELPE